MPELPEVETLRRELSEALLGRHIKTITSDDGKLTRPLSVAVVNRRLRGQTIKAIGRRAKVLIISLGPVAMLIHLKMTGQLIVAEPSKPLVIGGHPQPGGLDNLPNKYTRLVMTFTDGAQLFFNDLRRFAWLKVIPATQVATDLSHLGVEPLDKNFTKPEFINLIARYANRPIKQVLLDQTILAGIGNIYADESCFKAKINPTKKVGQIKPAELGRLYQAIRSILTLAIKKKGTSARNYLRSDGTRGGFVPYLKVYGRAGEKCKRCQKEVIHKIKFHGRGTHFCPKCQKKARPLDRAGKFYSHYND